VWLYSYRKASEDARGGCGRAARSEPGSSGGESKKGEDGGKADPLEEAGNLVGSTRDAQLACERKESYTLAGRLESSKVWRKGGGKEKGKVDEKDSGRCRLSNKLLRARAIEVDDEYAVENNGGRDVGAGT
jgi:hypothetical protein